MGFNGIFNDILIGILIGILWFFNGILLNFMVL